MAKIRICKGKNCKDAATAQGYCRLHYLKNWKQLREEKQKKSAQKLNRYIEFILKKHPDRYVEVVRQNLNTSQFSDFTSERFGDGEAPEGEEILLKLTQEDDELRDLLKDIHVEKDF